MTAVTTLLAHLLRPEVAEVQLVGGRKPTALVGTELTTIAEDLLSNDDLMRLLFRAGGSRYVDSLGVKPTHWRTRVETVGAITVSAAMHGDVIEARFTLRDGVSVSPGAAAGTSDPPQAPAAQATARASGPPDGASASKSAEPPPLEPPAVSSAPRSPVVQARSAAATTSPPQSPPRSPPRQPRAFGGDNEPASFAPTPSFKPADPRSPVVTAITMPGSPRGLLDDRSTRPTKPMMERPDMAAIERAHLEAEGNARDGRGSFPDTFELQDDPTAPGPVVDLDLPPSFPSAPPPPGEGPRDGAFEGRRRSSTRSEPPRWSSSEQLREAGRRSTRPATTVTDPRIPLAPTLPNLNSAATVHGSQLRMLLDSAREAGASDLHIVAGRLPLLRVAGRLGDQGHPLDAAVVDSMIIPRAPTHALEALDREGSCRFAMDEGDAGRFRVQLARHRGGLMAAIRPIPRSVPSLAALGFPELVAQLTRRSDGLVLVASHTGNGRSTTLASMIDLLSTETTRSIVTVEDPIEHVHPRKRALVSQREVHTHARDRLGALEAALGEAPDVWVAGDICDAPTAELVLRATEAGHLVLASITASSAAKAIEKLLDLVPAIDRRRAQSLLATSLRMVVAQRLLPNVEGSLMIAAVEVLPTLPVLTQMLREGRTNQIPSLHLRAKDLGIVRLEDSLREIVQAGRVASNVALAAMEGTDDRDLLTSARSGSVPPNASSPPVVSGAAAGIRPPSLPPPAPSGPAPAPIKGGLLDRVFKKGG